MGDDDRRAYDFELMKSAAQKLEDAGAELLGVAEAAPDQIRGGPYTEECAAILKLLLEASTELGIRLRLASAAVEDAEWAMLAVEETNLYEVGRMAKELEEE